MQAAGIGALAVGCATKAFLALRHLRREFGWQVYRALGDDPKMQRMFLHRQLLFVLVVLAGFSFFQVWLLRAAAAALAGPRAIGWVEIAVTAVVCMATLCVTLSAAVHEAAWSMYACVGVYACAPAYIVYKLVVAATGQHLDRSEVSAHNASSRCMIVLLGALLVLDVALALVSLVVARGFGRGLRQQLRHFHTLSRSPVDLESGVYVGHDADSPSRPSPDGQGQADHASSGTGPSQRTVGSVLSWMAANTKESVRESWLLFRAFFCGLGVADEPEATETGEAAETAEIADTPSTQPTLQLYHSMPKFSAMALHDIFGPACSASLQGSQDLSVAGECRRSSESTECGSLCFGDMSVSDPDLPRLGSYGSFHPDARPDTPVTLELLLSVEELNTINGELAVAASASTINRSFIGGGLAACAGSPAPSWSLVSTASCRTSIGWVSNSVLSSARQALAGERPRGPFYVSSFVDEFSLHASTQSPLALRVACPDDISICSDDSRSALQFSAGSGGEVPPADDTQEDAADNASAVSQTPPLPLA
ncbi:hypothetical protein IWQ56_001357 [Coemansia nantahalensis]|nr:hypothetical protein IWQ56_001357 [Coemansia nantahalensis]